MEHVVGRVLHGDEVLADRVEITVVNSRARGKQWYGCFVVPGPWSPDLVGPLRLEFEDGRRGEILVRGTKSPASDQTTVLFKGASSLA